LKVETRLVSNASGSARLRLANSDFLVGVKIELASPLPDKPQEGRLEFLVDGSVRVCFNNLNINRI
jgi:exosome complex component RRP42